MRLDPTVADGLLDQVALWADGGSIALYSRDPLDLAAVRLVDVSLPSPAFAPASGGVAVGYDVEPVRIALTGEAAWGQLFTMAGLPIATLTVGTTAESDVQLDRLDFQSGGRLIPARLVLRLPA